MEGKRLLGHQVQLCEEEVQGDFQTAHKIKNLWIVAKALHTFHTTIKTGQQVLSIMKRMHLICLSINRMKSIFRVGHPRSHLLEMVVQRMRI